MDDYNLVGFVMKYTQIKRRIAASYLKDKNLNAFESILLSIVYKHGQCTQDKIGEITMSDGATIARSLKKLEDQQFVFREPDPNNGRKKIVSITEAGSELYDKVRNDFRKSNEIMFKGITFEEQKQLESILEKVYKNLDSIEIPSN
ncbi:MarR family winged helix-turn-helix transcriptional regulator [Companilactobacillus kimchiensis]|uniref:Regulatory protein MarR n=1 Tax=Companilactobacillus kimchiensis TaxID=993692 RepID=A0A0R2LE80_9LACO|nr:MarR family winged helix-turn-helix transcriptional regulator [Companilactobacillus kimchiensis]KRN99851.1 regulatory protein MarR [Companilactobacillus kimchiensis]